MTSLEKTWEYGKIQLYYFISNKTNFGGWKNVSKLQKIMDDACWKRDFRREISKVQFRADVGISAATLTKLNRNELVALSVLVKICHILKCDIGDIMEVIPKEWKI